MYPWLYPKLFEAMHDDPSFIYKLFHQYHDQILEASIPMENEDDGYKSIHKWVNNSMDDSKYDSTVPTN